MNFCWCNQEFNSSYFRTPKQILQFYFSANLKRLNGGIQLAMCSIWTFWIQRYALTVWMKKLHGIRHILNWVCNLNWICATKFKYPSTKWPMINGMKFFALCALLTQDAKFHNHPLNECCTNVLVNNSLSLITISPKALNYLFKWEFHEIWLFDLEQKKKCCSFRSNGTSIRI